MTYKMIIFICLKVVFFCNNLLFQLIFFQQKNFLLHRGVEPRVAQMTRGTFGPVDLVENVVFSTCGGMIVTSREHSP